MTKFPDKWSKEPEFLDAIVSEVRLSPQQWKEHKEKIATLEAEIERLKIEVQCEITEREHWKDRAEKAEALVKKLEEDNRLLIETIEGMQGMIE